MKECFKKASSENIKNKKSILYRNLEYNFGSENVGYLYNNIIHSRSTSDNSFNEWFYKKNRTEEGVLNNIDINGEPLFSEVTSWLKYLDRISEIEKVFVTDSFKTTPSEFLDLSEGFVFYLVNKLFKEGTITPEELLDTNHTSTKKIMNSSYKDFITKLKEISEDYRSNIIDTPANSTLLNELQEKLERNNEIIDQISNNKLIFFKSISKYLKNKLSIDIKMDNILSDDIETKEDKGFKDSIFSKNAIEFSTKDGAPASIKLLIASLPAVQKTETGYSTVPNEMGLPKNVNYNKTFNYIQEKLLNVDNDIDVILEELNSLSNNKPELKILIKRLNFNSKTYNPSSEKFKRIAETQLRTQFVNQFNKTKLNFALHIIEPSGLIKIINANQDTVQNKIINEWRNAFETKLNRNPEILERVENNPNYYSKLKRKEILNLLGIEGVDPSLLSDDTVNAIRNYGLNSAENLENIFNSLNSKKSKDSNDKSEVLTRLREISNLLIGDDVNDFSTLNVENKLVYAITLNSYISTFANELSLHAGNPAKLMEKFPELFKSAYSRDSYFLNEVVKGTKLKLGLYDGFKVDDNNQDGNASKNLQHKDLILQRMSGMLQEGYYTFLRTADRGVEYYVHLDGSRGPIIDGINAAKKYYKSHLLAEIETTRIKNTNVKFFDKNNKELRTFGYTNKKGKIIKLVGDKSKNNDKVKSIFTLEEIQGLENPTENPKVLDFINDMIENIVSVETEYLEKNQVLNKKNKNNPYLKELIQEYGDIDNVITMYALNYHIGNIETTKLFTGDLAFYKNPGDVFKRMSMMNSTKNSVRTDDELLYILNDTEYKFEKGSAGEITNKIKTITLEDIESDIATQYSEEELNTLKKVFGDNKEFIKAYSEINEADGFAYVTIDALKRMLIRANNWTNKDQILYDKLAKGNYSYDANTLHRWTMLKYQYTGKLMNEDLLNKNLNIPAGRKFAIMPLVPGLIGQNTVLGKLNQQMLDNGVEMGFFTSTAKFGYTEHKQIDGSMSAHKIYDSNGNFNEDLDFSQHHDILDWRYMGDQLKISNSPKSKISGTQRNKIIFGNFYVDGYYKTKDSSINEKLNLYQELQKNKAERAKTKLANKLGYSNGNIDINDPVKFIDTLINQGIQQGYSSSDIFAINNLMELPIFETLPNKIRLESLLTSTLMNNAIINKRRGDMLAQASDVGFEINEKVAKESERHNLKFYRFGKDGKTMLPMEIMVALPNELIQYVIDNYGNGKVLTEEALEKFNEDIAKDQIEYENNIGNENYETSELTKARTYSGFRIPTQDASSLDVAQVKKFFMPHMTGMVVVPKAIVAKTGSDFDIDKINFYMPNIKLVRRDEIKIVSKAMRQQGLTNERMKGIIEIQHGIEMDYGKNDSKLEQIFYDEILNLPESVIENDSILAIVESFKLYASTNPNVGQVIGFTIPEGDSSDINSMKPYELENSLIKTENEIILHPDNHLKLLAPLTESKIRDIASELESILNPNKVKEQFYDVFYGKTNIEKFVSFLAGKAGVGQVAVHITNHILAQISGLQMKSLNNYFVENNEFIDLGKEENSSGENISQLLSELLTAYVDIAKDPYILELNATSQTANTVLMMVRWGVPIKEVFYFMNQPIIKDYLKRRALAESVTSIKGLGKEFKSESINKSFDKFNINKEHSKMLHIIEEKIEEGDLNVIRPSQNLYNKVQISDLKRNLTKPEPNYQYQMLDLFLEYQRQSKLMQEMIRASSPDTQQFKNISMLDNQIELKNKVIENEMFNNYEDIFNKTFIGNYYGAKKDYYKQVSPFFLTQHPNIKPNFDTLKDLYSGKIQSAAGKLRILSKIDSQFINYKLSKWSPFDFETVFNTLFVSDNSLPKQLMKIKKYYADKGIVHELLENIEPLINYKKQGYDSMKLSIRKLEEADRQKMIAQFDEMSTDQYSADLKETVGVELNGSSKLSDRIFLYNLIQSGIDNHPFSLKDVISPATHLKYMKKFVVSGENQNLDEVIAYTGVINGEIAFPGEFVLNNIKPLVGKKIDPLSAKYSQIYQKRVIKHSSFITDFQEKGSNNFLQYDGNSVPSSVEDKIIDATKSEANSPNNPLNKDC